MRVLLAEDDPMIGASIRQYLRNEGYAVDHLRDGRSVNEVLDSEHFDLLLLDLALPTRSGMEILQQLRSVGNAMPVIIVTARDRVDDRVAGLDFGADDYLVKPFSLRELAARIRCALRRSVGRSDADIELDGIRICTHTRRVSCHGEDVLLSAKEYAIVEALTRRPGTILSKAQIEERLYGWGDDVDSNTVAVHIHSIRQKLGQNFIHTLRGVGYFVPGSGKAEQ
ncbi:response regulator [Noviherbaspirillum pedocola]|uniref:Response regulator transcription factor n=1 Tax=Noviherbaspirillum pedocola TaxID=2801341 RepID=A0A934STP0_9BURK|nr:response regulator transcription factor [Noviherbaspirillum pedocola]MBK4736576.1 response regulator transcription factor [Noviherbaspirillum pedocola]